MSQRIKTIDGLRGVCILLVLLFHYTYVYPVRLGQVEAPWYQVPWGGVGVSIFFVVSGMVIMKSLESSTPWSFAVSRFARLYPAYFVSLTITTASLHFWGDWYRDVSIAQFWANATMMQYYLGFRNIDGVYWSLRVEIAFYVVSALMFFGLKGKRFWHTLAAFALIAFWGNFLILRMELPAAVQIIPKLFLFEFIHYFIIGIVCFKLLFDRRHESNSVWLRNILLILAAISFADLLINKPLYKTCAVSLAVSVLSIATWRPRNLVIRLMNSGPLQYLGNKSYSLYLLHQVIGYLLLQILQRSGVDLPLAILCTVCVVFLLTEIVHRSIEVRLSNRLRIWLTARTTTSGVNNIERLKFPQRRT